MGQSSKFLGYALNAVAAAGADIEAANGEIILTGFGNIRYNDIQRSQRKVKIIPFSAGVSRVTDLTTAVAAASANGLTYRVSYEQVVDATGEVKRGDIIITSLPAGETNAAMATKLKAAVDALIANGDILGTAGAITTATFTVTAAATARILRFFAPNAGISISVGTAGSPAVGLGSQLAQYNIQNLVTSNNYAQIVIPFADKDDASTVDGSYNTLIYALNNADADTADFLTKAQALFDGIIPGSSPAAANPELISVL